MAQGIRGTCAPGAPAARARGGARHRRGRAGARTGRRDPGAAAARLGEATGRVAARGGGSMPATARQIVSLLPRATEILYALGLGDRVCGVTHECDYPPDAQTKRILVRPAFDPDRLSPAEIDAAVSRLAREGQSVYRVDEEAIRELQPEMIVTQTLCEVCAVTGDHLDTILPLLGQRPAVVALHPHALADILEDIRRVGDACGVPEAAAAVVADLERRMAAVRARTAAVAHRPRVACIEWYEPPC